jgi:TolB-like protein/Flp pilus assembly protein TadD
MLYRFDPFEIDVDAQELRRSGTVLAVEPQVFALLVYLVENRDRVVSRDDILEAVWHGRIVSEAALSSRVKAARQVIGDDGQAQRLIRTIHKRGFRFVASVESDEPRAAAVALADTTTPAGVGDQSAPASQARKLAGSEPSIVILPFQTIGEPGVLAEGLSHDLITRLGRTRWLFVIARGSAFRFIGARESPTDIARMLRVRYVTTGSVQTDGRRIRIHATLTDATTGSEVWSEQFDRVRDDLFAIQAEISDAIAGAVESQIEFLERGRSLLKPSENLDAWEAYHRGCWHMYKFRPEHYEEAEGFFLRSIELDASSPRPFSGLSFVHWQRAFLEISKDRSGEMARAMEFAETAIALDPRDPQGHHALGRAHLLAGDIEASERELQKAVDLNPSFAIGHYSLAYALYFAGLNEESQQAVSRAQSLSPYDPMRFAMLSLKAMSLISTGATEEAATLMAQAVEESNAHYHILAIAVIAFAAAQKKEQSTHYLERLRALRPDYNSQTYLRAFPLFRDEDIRLAKRVFG